MKKIETSWKGKKNPREQPVPWRILLLPLDLRLTGLTGLTATVLRLDKYCLGHVMRSSPPPAYVKQGKHTIVNRMTWVAEVELITIRLTLAILTGGQALSRKKHGSTLAYANWRSHLQPAHHMMGDKRNIKNNRNELK